MSAVTYKLIVILLYKKLDLQVSIRLHVLAFLREYLEKELKALRAAESELEEKRPRNPLNSKRIS